jgi:hypothetical protein
VQVHQALVVVAFRETAWHLLFYGPTVASHFLQHQFAQFADVLNVCDCLMQALQEAAASCKHKLPGVSVYNECASWQHMEHFCKATIRDQGTGLVILDTAAQEWAFEIISRAACIPAQLQISDGDATSESKVLHIATFKLSN